MQLVSRTFVRNAWVDFFCWGDDMTGGKDGAPEKSRQEIHSHESDSPFDIWLKRGLHQLFDDVASEPIPEELLRLIEENRDDRSS